jgi:hypothetical protein
MAVVTLKSTAITNADATPVDLSAAYLTNGRVREAVGTVEITSGDSIGSTYRLARVWSGWRISELLESHDDNGTTATADLGLYDIASAGGAVVDADFFASAIVLNGGAVNAANITFESGVFNIDDIEKRIWEGLGLTEDPKKWYDLTLTLTAASDGTGTFSLQTRWVDGT